MYHIYHGQLIITDSRKPKWFTVQATAVLQSCSPGSRRHHSQYCTFGSLTSATSSSFSSSSVVSLTKKFQPLSPSSSMSLSCLCADIRILEPFMLQTDSAAWSSDWILYDMCRGQQRRPGSIDPGSARARETLFGLTMVPDEYYIPMCTCCKFGASTCFGYIMQGSAGSPQPPWVGCTHVTVSSKSKVDRVDDSMIEMLLRIRHSVLLTNLFGRISPTPTTNTRSRPIYQIHRFTSATRQRTFRP